MKISKKLKVKIKNLPVFWVWFMVTLSFYFFVLSFNFSRADGPQIFITWSTKGYAPAGYAGKILPVNGSHIKAVVGALSGTGFLDLSKEEIAWYVNGAPVEDAVGGQSAELDVTTLTQSSLELKVQLLSMAGGPYSKTIEIPIVQPQAIMEYRSPGENISGNDIFLAALPFFFTTQNISDLNFSWQVNGESPVNLADPQRLDIKSSSGFPSGSQVQVYLNIQAGGESAAQTKTFTAP